MTEEKVLETYRNIRAIDTTLRISDSFLNWMKDVCIERAKVEAKLDKLKKLDIEIDQLLSNFDKSEAFDILSKGIDLDENGATIMTSEEFLKQYGLDHELCPKCGSNSYNTTLVGYVLYMDDLDNYKDKNRCTCMYCGDKHITHDRVSKEI